MKEKTILKELGGSSSLSLPMLLPNRPLSDLVTTTVVIIINTLLHKFTHMPDKRKSEIPLR